MRIMVPGAGPIVDVGLIWEELLLWVLGEEGFRNDAVTL